MEIKKGKRIIHDDVLDVLHSIPTDKRSGAYVEVHKRSIIHLSELFNLERDGTKFYLYSLPCLGQLVNRETLRWIRYKYPGKGKKQPVTKRQFAIHRNRSIKYAIQEGAPDVGTLFGYPVRHLLTGKNDPNLRVVW